MNALRRYMDRRLQKKNLPISSSEYEDFEKFSGKKSDKVAEPKGKEYAKDTDELSKAQIIKDIEAAADEVELSGEL